MTRQSLEAEEWLDVQEATYLRVVRLITNEFPEVREDSIRRESSLQADLGLDSGSFISLLVALEDEFGCELQEELENIDLSRLEEVGNVVAWLVEVIEEQSASG